MMISLDEQFIKTELEIEKMQAAGHVNALALEEIKKLREKTKRFF